MINGRDEAGLKALAAELEAAGAQVAAEPGSVADDDVCARLTETCVERFGRIVGLVNNAGVVRDRTLLKMTGDELDEVLAVNLRGSFACGMYAARAMAANGGGWITNVASSAAFYGSFGQSNYAASKAGTVGMTRAWSHELARRSIRVNAVCPVAHTDMSEVVLERVRASAVARGEPPPDGDALGLGAPAEVAAVVIALALADGVTGQVVTFDGRRAARWSHPRETSEVRADAPWDPAALARELAGGALPGEPMVAPAIGG